MHHILFKSNAKMSEAIHQCGVSTCSDAVFMLNMKKFWLKREI